jgi:hypothetical protein
MLDYAGLGFDVRLVPCRRSAVPMGIGSRFARAEFAHLPRRGFASRTFHNKCLFLAKGFIHSFERMPRRTFC